MSREEMDHTRTPMNNPSEKVLERQATAESSRKGHPVIAFAVRAFAGIAVVAFLLWHYDARPIFRLLGRERLSFFAAAVALYVGGQAMSAFRWQILARIAGLPGPYGEYAAYYFAGMFTNLFIPGLIGGDALRAVYLGRHYGRIGAATASVAADRGIGLLALFWFAADVPCC